jgi:hypothetical protein
MASSRFVVGGDGLWAGRRGGISRQPQVVRDNRWVG